MFAKDRLFGYQRRKRQRSLAVKGLLFLACIAFVTVACSSANRAAHGDEVMVTGKGTIRFIPLEGGFYGIVGEDGKHYDPTNLEPEFRKDDLKIRFKARILKDVVGIHMWGEIIEIESISREE